FGHWPSAGKCHLSSEVIQRSLAARADHRQSSAGTDQGRSSNNATHLGGGLRRQSGTRLSRRTPPASVATGSRAGASRGAGQGARAVVRSAGPNETERKRASAG